MAQRVRRWPVALLPAVLGLVAVGCPRQSRTPATAPPPVTAQVEEFLGPPAQIAPEGVSAQILHYDLTAEIVPQKHWLKATAKIAWEVLKETGRLEFRLRPNLQILRLTDGEGRDLEYERNEEGAVSVRLPAPLAPGAKPSLTVEYKGEIYGPRGGARRQRLWDYIGNEGTYVRFEAQWYPQVEGDTATADLTIIGPPGWTAVSSGELIEQDSRTCRWRVAYPAVGLSFCAAEYALTESRAGRIPMQCYTFAPHTRRARELLEKCGRLFSFLESIYGPYPFPKFAIAEIPDLYGGGHGDQSFIMLPEKAFTEPFDEEFVAHEMAHNWWGSQIFCTDSEFPIEGFATYSEALWREHVGGAEALRRAMRAQAEAVLMHSLDADAEASCFRAESGPLLYQKGAWILHMSRRLLGDAAWFRVVRKFATENAGKTITCRRLQQALEAGYGHSLEQFFQQWLYGTGVPWVKGKIAENTAGHAIVTLTQAVIKSEGRGEEAWELVPSNFSLLVDLLLRYEGGEQRQAVWLTKPRQEYEFALPGKPTGLVVDPDEWLLDHSKGLAGELEAEMEELEEELREGLAEEMKAGR